MKIGIYVINLARSRARWDGLSQKADKLGILLERVEGVDGAALATEERNDLDLTSFLRENGRAVLPGEYGCYRSHLLAVSKFQASEHEAAIILEDDVELAAGLVERATAILEAVPEAELVKLLNHRTKWFRKRATSRLGDEVGRSIHGPQGSAACYLITRSGAEKILKHMKVMRYPVDVALERGWHTELGVFTVRLNVLNLSSASKTTEIATRDDYRKGKFRGPRRAITHLLRALDYIRRIRYCLS
ncbi:glycosyltransferase family 25 protein [Rhizobium sp. SL42]|uniref:glycosyltransferase family 25 protein n=1 Tax=Rhizobium sp. SL42 TaxID=2806346 RepID=UPI001F3657A5|nr:glycosyltransferase family 25 protein [Rhizobium sp. SL42]UJW74835.1 glycosyltransferase family 25 protein [Rhizobium sp. SL42]